MRTFYIISLVSWMFLFVSHKAAAQTTVTVGSSGTYANLKSAFDAINDGSVTGVIEIQIISNTTEPTTASLNASGFGSANYSSVTIYPTTAGVSIAGNFAASLITLNGADNVVFDGRLNAAGSTKDLTLINSNTGAAAATIRFMTSAENNIVRYCNIQSSCYSIATGMLYFSSSNVGNGNDNNIVEYCNITNAGGNRPLNALFSSGGIGRENSGNIIRNNNFYDFFNPNNNSNGIMISYMSTDWTITGNSFYETTVIAPAGAFKFYPIFINTGVNTVSNNYIGGSAPLCAGSAFTVNSNFAHYFCAIFFNGETTTAGLIQNNTIQNIDYSSIEDNPWDGMFINSGKADVMGNTIGSGTGNNSIVVRTPVAAATATISGGVVTSLTLLGGGSGYTIPPVITFSTAGSTTPATATATISGGVVTGLTLLTGGAGYTAAPNVIFDGQSNNYSTTHGMICATTSVVNISGNTIGSVTTSASNYYSHGFEGIYNRGALATCNITGNLIGSETTAASIQTSATAINSTQKQDIYGLYNSSTGTCVIADNVVANMVNNYSGINSGSRTRGIQTTAGTNTIQGNTVRNLSTPSGQSGGGSNVSVIGISQTSSTAGTTQTVSGNFISDLSNSHSSAKVQLTGLYYAGPTSGTNTVSGNFVENISVVSSDITASIFGIVMNSGFATCSNNIVNVGNGVTSGCLINGILDATGSGHNMGFYFNTIYIGGSVSSGTTSITSAIYNANNTSIRNYRNNIFYNNRSGGTTGKHFAIVMAGVANTTIDYNDYFVAGATLGKIGSLEKADLNAWKLGTSQDANSLNLNPAFASPGGNSALDYYTSTVLQGVSGTGVLTDYAGLSRGSTPQMGALEANNYVWQGAISTDFGTAGNWSGGAVPPDGADITFAANPDRSCVLDQNRIVGSITNAQSTDKFLVNGKQLTITGNLNFTNSAQIDATPAASKVIFAGSVAQNIPAGSFVSNTIDSLTINNANGLTLNGDLTIVSGIALRAGNFTIGANTLTFNGIVTEMTGSVTGGTSTNMIIGGNGATISMPDFTLNNLTINRANGVTLYGNLSIVGTLTLTNGTLTVGAKTLTLSGSSPVRTSGYIDASNSSATVVFNNSAALTLPASIFSASINNLTISGAGGVTSSSDMIVDGVLNLSASNPSASKGSLDMWDAASMKTLTMGANATTIGAGEVTGIVTRNYFVPNVCYTFGSEFTTVTFPNTGVLPSSWSFKIEIGSAPAWKATAIQRKYDIIRSGGSGSLPTVKFHYLDGELNGNSESNLSFFGFLVSNSSVTEYGKINSSTIDNWVSLSGDIGFAPLNFGERSWTLSPNELPSFTWQGTVPGDGTNWNQNMNWVGGVVPDATSDVIIPASCPDYPTLPANASIHSINIEVGGIVNGGVGTTLTINGASAAWTNHGTFNPGTSTVVFSNASATMSGASSFYNLTINAAAGLTLTSNNIMRIAGTLSNSGTLDATVFPNIVEYNGANQSVINPNGATIGYHDLTISGSGTKTFPATSLSIMGDFLIAETATANAAAAITIGGDATIDAGATWATGNYSHSLAGDFYNNGTFTAAAGNTMTMNGSIPQSIAGASTTNFYHLTINNGNGVSAFCNINVDGTFSLSNGVFEVGETTLGINGTISKTLGNIAVNNLSSMNFGGTSAITLPASLFATTPSLNNLTINRSGGVTLGNQNLTIEGLLTLTAGTLNIGANSLTIAGSSPVRTSGTIDASNSAATLVFINTNPIVLPASVFTGSVSNLTINAIGGVSASSDFTINGILNLQSENPSDTKGCLDMWNGTTMSTVTLGANATTAGVGDVTGIIHRSTIVAGITYSFGNPYMSAYFTTDGTLPSEISVKVAIGAAPSWRSGAINREIEIIQTGGSGTKAVFSCHYLDSELNGNIEDHLVLWVGLATNLEYGRSSFDAANNYVALSNIDLAFFSSTWGATKNISLDEYDTTTTITWNGSVSNSWTTVQNWTPNVGPSPTMNIIIPDASTTLNSPLLPAFTEIKTLTIQSAGILNSVAGAQLTINGGNNSWSNVGGTFNANTSNVIFTNANATVLGETNFHDLTINSGKILWMESGSIMRIAGTITNDGTWRTVVNGPTEVEYNGGNQIVVVPNAATNRYYTLILSGSGTKTLPATALTINNDFIMAGSASTAAAANLTIVEDFSIGSGASFTSGAFNHSIGGNFQNNGSFTASAGNTITMNGSTAAQNISGSAASTSFYNLTVNNTFAAGSLTVEMPVTINNTLSLNNKNIITSAAQPFVLAAGASVLPVGGSSTSFIDGPISKIGNTAFVFPVGDGTHWARIAIGAPTASSTFTAQYFVGNDNIPDAMATTPSPVLQNVSSQEYWTLNRTAGTGNATVTLYWEDASWSGISDCSTNNLRVAHWNSADGTWENNNDLVSTSGSCVGASAGSITTTAVVSDFSPFTFGSLLAASNPLPIVLLNFDANLVDGNIVLDWSTTSEINNDFFTVEKSSDGISFIPLGMVDAAGNSNVLLNYSFTDENPFTTINYYRLLQTDFDGKYSLSRVVSIDATAQNSENAKVDVFPNPMAAGENTNLLLSGFEAETNVVVSISNLLGVELYSKTTSIQNNGSLLLTLNSEVELASGTYLVNVVSGNRVVSKLLIVQ